LKSDPAFAGGFAAALELGLERLEALAAEERAAAAAHWARPIAPAAGVRPTADFETQMRLLNRWRRRDGSLGRRRVRRERLRTIPFGSAMDMLAKRLRALGIEVAAPAAATAADPCAAGAGG
jgi:hypothetical protein